MTESRDVIPWSLTVLTGLVATPVPERALSSAISIAERLISLTTPDLVIGVRSALGELARDSAYPAQATILADGRRTSAPLAASINALAAVGASEHDLVTVPAFSASLAVAELQRSTFDDWIDAFALGAEISLRLARGLAPDARPFIPASAVGQFGAALASSRLLRLDDERAGHALGLAAIQVSGVAMPGTLLHAYAVANAARAGVETALIARFDATGPLDGVRTIELMTRSPDLGDGLRDMAGDWVSAGSGASSPAQGLSRIRQLFNA